MSCPCCGDDSHSGIEDYDLEDEEDDMDFEIWNDEGKQ